MSKAVKGKARKESLYVRVVAPDDSVEFHDVTSKVGYPMPFSNPKATLALRVSDSSVVFSLLHLTKRAASGLIKKNLEFPRGPVARIERRAHELSELLQGSKIVAEVDGSTYDFTFSIDDAGAVEVSGEDTSLLLPRGAIQVSLFLFSKNANRPVGVGFIGHVGKPESQETVRRVVSMILNSVSQLVAFRLLTGIETVRVPSAPRSIVRPVRKSHERANVEVPAWLYTDTSEPALAGSGSVIVEIDLDQANPATSRLLMHFTPDKSLEPIFSTYRVAFEYAVTQKLRGSLGDDELRAIATDIVLGEVSAGTIERLNSALSGCVTGFDLTPTQHREHTS
ncbi:MAG: hypothetical protein ACKOW9_03465 [Candidatus Paceibacterota bacterium]